MFVIAILVIAALLFLLRAFLSTGAALDSKKIENELAAARVEIVHLIESKKSETAQETFKLMRYKIEEFCRIHNIKSEEKPAQIRFAHEFELWGQEMLAKNDSAQKPIVVTPQDNKTQPEPEKNQGNSISRAAAKLLVADIKQQEAISFWLCLLCYLTGTGGIETENNVIDARDLIKCFTSDYSEITGAVREVLSYKGPEREIAVLAAANRIKRLNDDLIHEFLTINIFIFRQVDYIKLETDLEESRKRLLYWMTNTLFPDIYKSTFKS